MGSSHLLPCPFCGEEAYEASFFDESWADDDVELIQYFVVGCRDCRFKFESDYELTRDDIISKWNTRAKALNDSSSPSFKSCKCGLPIVTESSPEYLQIWDRDQI